MVSDLPHVGEEVVHLADGLALLLLCLLEILQVFAYESPADLLLDPGHLNSDYDFLALWHLL